MQDLFNDTAYRTSALVTRTYSTSFSAAVRLLDRESQKAIYSIYGFVRFADEIVDTFHSHDKKELLEIDLEKLSLSDIINDVMERLTREKNLTFEELLGEKKDRRRIVYTFLAMLELIRLKMIRAYQTAAFGVIRIFPAVEA